MEYEILALDLDGTLTNSKKEISAPTLEALIDIQERGKKVVLASGRPTHGVVPLAKQLHLEKYGSYILSFNGGRITDCRTGQVIYNKTLPADVLAPLFLLQKNIQESILLLMILKISYPVSNQINTRNWNLLSIICRLLKLMTLLHTLQNRLINF